MAGVVDTSSTKRNTEDDAPDSGFGYEEIKGDLFSCGDTTALAHCISEDCAMGKGIAVVFRNKFGGVADLKKQVAQGSKTGKVAILKRGTRFVYYLITKRCYYNKPTYASLEKSITEMKTHVVHNGVKNLAMPKIGCGLDGLAWDKVSKMIKVIFHETDIRITVYYL